MAELFPGEEQKLHPLAEDHAVWRAKHLLIPDIHPLWGIEYGCRTVVIYSPDDLSCYWNQAENSPANPAVIKAIKVGQNVVDYATGREMPADKLTVREVKVFGQEAPKRGRPADRQAPPRRRLERRPAGGAQPDGHARASRR